MNDIYNSIQMHIDKGEFQVAISQIDNFITKKDPYQKNVIELNIIKIEILFLSGNYKEGLSLIEEIKERCKTKEFHLCEINLANLYVSYLIEIGRFDEILKKIFEAEELLGSLID
ncbi:MAG: hypothetical protein FK734_00625, partial [Asgard group archaeon]|nr:hypothetical protein [Asgard group archaeon]